MWVCGGIGKGKGLFVRVVVLRGYEKFMAFDIVKYCY